MAAKAKATGDGPGPQGQGGRRGCGRCVGGSQPRPVGTDGALPERQSDRVVAVRGCLRPRPDAATLVIADGQGNGLVVNAAADPAYVVEMIGAVGRLSGNTFDLGPEDGINVVVTDF